MAARTFAANLTEKVFTDSILKLEPVDEPTLLVFPAACQLKVNEYGSVVVIFLQHCRKMQDRFTIADVCNVVPGSSDSNVLATTFRSNVSRGIEEYKYGAAKFPYLRTNLQFITSDTKITITSYKIIAADGCATGTAQNMTLRVRLSTRSRQAIRQSTTRAERLWLARQSSWPPSACVAGVYARVDSNRGVWKAPAIVDLVDVIEPMIHITDLEFCQRVDQESRRHVCL